LSELLVELGRTREHVTAALSADSPIRMLCVP
jgi:hypothetical protein